MLPAKPPFAAAQRLPATLVRIAGVAGVLCLVAAGALTSACAQDGNPDAAWLQRSGQILQRAEHASAPAWAKPRITAQQRRWARRIMRATHRRQRQALASADPTNEKGRAGEEAHASPPAPRIEVFLTLGKGEPGRRRFKQQLKALAGQPGVVVALRGLPADVQRIDQLISLIYPLVKSIPHAPPVSLEPRRFRRAHIKVAPTVVFYRDGEPIVRFTGSLEIAWLKAQVKVGHTGDLGSRGPVHEITERNLIDIIRRRWASIDWAKEKAQAVRAYWQHYQPTRLPQAQRYRSFTINPTVVVTRTLRAPGGQVIARKGERINALAEVPFTGQIIAFDGAALRQVALARRLADAARAHHRRPILLTQSLPGAPGFDALTRLEQSVGARVYLLDSRLTMRFDLKHLPAVVRSAGQVFEVEELPPKLTLQHLARARHSSTVAAPASHNGGQ